MRPLMPWRLKQLEKGPRSPDGAAFTTTCHNTMGDGRSIINIDSLGSEIKLKARKEKLHTVGKEIDNVRNTNLTKTGQLLREGEQC